MEEMEHLPEDIALAIEIIRQLENLDYTPETILQAMMHVCQDTLNKLPEEQQEHWRQQLQLSQQKS